MSTTSIGSTVKEFLKSFDLLPDPEKRQAASEILRRTYASSPELDEAQLAAAYAEFGETDRHLAEEGIEDYEKGLASEDAE